jgi:hypothetical protein
MLWPASKTPRLYLKLKANGIFAQGGDFGDFISLKENYLTELDELANFDVSLTKDSFFQGYGGEIGIEVKNYQVGIGVDYLVKTFSVDYQYRAINSDLEEKYIWECNFSVLPIHLFIRYKILRSKFLNASFTLGEGVYIIKYKEEAEVTFNNHPTLTYNNSYIKANKANLGFHFGVTLDFNISKNIALSVDAAYRLVKFDEIEGEDFYQDDTQEIQTENDLYYKTNESTGDAKFGIGKYNPPRNNWDESQATFNLNGFSLNIGLKITFGS